MDVVVSDETYRFICRRCGWQWQRAYQIRRWVDCDGDEHVACCIAGAPAATPWSGVACPQCNGYRTVLLPQRASTESW